MSRRTCVFLLGLFAAFTPIATAPLHADAAQGDARKSRLFSQFIAPCCWRENLLVHRSPKADELRADIDKRIEAGQSDEQIKAALVGEYSTRILALPEGTLAIWLSSAPIAAALTGLGITCAFIVRSIRKHKLGNGPEKEEAEEDDKQDERTLHS